MGFTPNSLSPILDLLRKALTTGLWVLRQTTDTRRFNTSFHLQRENHGALMNGLNAINSSSTFEYGLSGLSDESLVSAAQTGDSLAFVELKNRHANKLLHRIYRITKNWQDAEDVLQESFLKAYLHLPTFVGTIELFILDHTHRDQLFSDAVA